MKHPILATVLSALTLSASAQQAPVDPAYRIGKLDNGLTYYIRHNAKEAGLADFYIAQRVGSILEEPRQRGLAHFLEHMAFNGTRHFRGDSTSLGIVPWCESIGVKFGANLNAYTSVDQTVYNISAVPLRREGIIDSTLLILADWSHDLLLTDKEIDKERGVIHEEWRTRRSGKAAERMMERIMPVIYKGSKYEDCLPIGSMDIVDNFPYQDLRDYYHKWYRPDLQAIIVVGDIDVDQIERKIKATFSGIAKPEGAAERIYYPVPDNDAIRIAVDRDAEQPLMLATLYMKRDAVPDNRKAEESERRAAYVDRLVQSILNERLGDLKQQAHNPVHSATSRINNFYVSRTKQAFSISFGVRQEDVKGSFLAALGVVEKARQTGFTEDELQRAKALLLKGAERRAAEEPSRVNRHFVNKAVNHFLTSAPLTTDSNDLADQQRWAGSVTLQEVNQAAQRAITNRNEVLTVLAPDKPDFRIPSNEELKSYIAEARAQRYTADEQQALPKQLLTKQPKAGKIKQQTKIAHDATLFTLSNGVKVAVKSTDYERDNITLKMWGPGGELHLDAADVASYRQIPTAISLSGVADFEQKTLTKMLASHNVRLHPTLGDEEHGWSGSSTAADLETLFQLLYLHITQPRTDRTAFQSEMNRMRSFLKNRDANPQVGYNDSLRTILYNNHPRMQATTQEFVDRVDYDRVVALQQALYSGVKGDTILLVGNVDLDVLKPLLQRYVASLPQRKQKLGAADEAPQLRAGDETITFRKKMATPSALVNVYYTFDAPYTPQTDLQLDMLGRVLQIAYTESIREEKGGTYGVSVRGQVEDEPTTNALLKISFRTDPKKYDDIIPIIYQQLRVVAEQGPSATSLEKVKLYLKKSYEQNAISNGYWQYVLEHQLRENIDFDKDYTSLVDAVTGKDLSRLAQRILDQKRRIEVTMLPEE